MIATYRLQLSPGAGLRTPCARWCPTCASWGSRTCTCRPRCRRGRARRTATTSSIPRGSPTRWAGRRGCARWPARASQIVLDIVPNHMGVSDENRWWADERERARVFDYDPEDGWYRRFFDIDDLAGRARRGPRGVRPRPRQGPRARARRRGRRAAGRPPRRARRPGRLPGAAARRRRRARVGREDPRTPASRCATGRSRAPSATSSSTTPPRCSSTRRARRRSRGCPDAGEPLRGGRGAAQLEQATTTFAREVERLRELLRHRRRSRRRWRRCRSTAPTSSRGRGASRTPTARAIAAAADGRARRRAGAARARPRRVRHALPADLAAGHGQGRRGHRVLPLPAAARAQRGRRRPGALRALGRRLPRRQRGAGRALPAQPARHPDPRHQALGRRARAHRRAEHDGRRVGGAGRGAGCAEADAPDEHSAYLVLQTLVGVLADRARAARGLRREGAARGQARTTLGGARRGLRGGGAPLRAGSASSARPTASSPSPSASPPRAGARRWASCCSS